MKKCLTFTVALILVFVLAAPLASAKGPAQPATPTEQSTVGSPSASPESSSSYKETFSAAGLACTVVKKGLMTRATCSYLGYVIEASLFIKPSGQGIIRFTRRGNSTLPVSRTISLATAAAGEFDAIAPVTEGLPAAFINHLGQVVRNEDSKGTLARCARDFLFACVGTLQSARTSEPTGEPEQSDTVTIQAAWPWDYVAYAICFWSCEAGGAGGLYCGELCQHYTG